MPVFKPPACRCFILDLPKLSKLYCFCLYSAFWLILISLHSNQCILGNFFYSEADGALVSLFVGFDLRLRCFISSDRYLRLKMLLLWSERLLETLMLADEQMIEFISWMVAMELAALKFAGLAAWPFRD